MEWCAISSVWFGPVNISHEVIEGVIGGVQDFMQGLLFTQRNFFNEAGTAMLGSVVFFASFVWGISNSNPKGSNGINSSSVLADLKGCLEKVLLLCKSSKDTREPWFGVNSVTSSIVAHGIPRTLVQISNVVEVGHVKYRDDSNDFGLRNCSRAECT